MEDKARCCQNCRAPCAGDFMKVADLQYSGLVIYLHTKKDEQKKAGTSKCDDTYILHNTGSKHLKRQDYITELHRFKPKCGQCKTIVQRVRSLLNEIKAIKENDIIGVCEHCKRTNLECKRCDFIVSKFISTHQKKCEEKQERFKIWLCKVKHLLQAILDGETVCQHRVYKDTELEKILQELKQPLLMREPDIDFFPSLDFEQLTSLKSLSESKDMLEELLTKIKLEGEKHFSSEDSLYPSTSKESCLCKYLKEGRFRDEASGLFKLTKDSEQTGVLPQDLSGLLSQEVYKSLIKRLIDLSKALPHGLHLNKDLILRLIKTLNIAINQGLSRDIIKQLINELNELNQTMTHLSKDLNKEVIKGLIDDLNGVLTLGESKDLNKDLIQLLIDLTELLTHELSRGLTKEQSQMLSKSVHKDIALALSKSSHKDIPQSISKRFLKEQSKGSLTSQRRVISQGLPKSISRDIRQHSPKGLSREIRQSSPKIQGKEIGQESPKISSREIRQRSPKSQSREILQRSPKSQSREIRQRSPKSQSREIRQRSPKSQSREIRQRSPKSESREEFKQTLPKGPTKEETQKSLKKQSREMTQDSPKLPRKELVQDMPKEIHKGQESIKRQVKETLEQSPKDTTQLPSRGVHKDEVQGLPKKDIMHKAKSQISTRDLKKDNISSSPTKEKPIPKDIIQLVQKLADLNKALTERDQDEVNEISGDINKALSTGLPEMTKKILQELTDLCNPAVKGIPQNSKIGIINDLLKNTRKALSEGLSKDQNKKVVQGLLNDLNKAINQAVKEEQHLPKVLKRFASKDASKEPSSGLSSKALAPRSQDVSKRRLKDVERETSDKGLSKTKTIKRKDSIPLESKDKTYKKDIKYGKSDSKIKSLIEKKLSSPKMKLTSKGKERRPFEDEDDALKKEAKYEKSSPKKKSLASKTSKGSKVKLPSKGKENLEPDGKSKLKTPSGKLKVAKQMSEAALLKMLKDNKEKVSKYKAYKERQLAREREIERRRLKELSVPVKSAKKKEPPPPPPPEQLSDIIVDCNMPQCHVPKSKLMIKGDAMVPFDPHYKDVLEKDKLVEPLLFKTQLEFGDGDKIEAQVKHRESINYEVMFKDGILRYKLSDKEFIDKGLTKLPTEKIMRRMNIYKMEPANPQYDWFMRHKSQKQLFYDNGAILADIDDDARGRWYYRNGAVALDYYNAAESNIGQRYVVYSSGEEMDNGKLQPRTVLALFDVLGNGVVYDHHGNIRLKYNQSEGLLVDPKLGPPGKWKWHTLNDPPVLQQVFVNTCMKERDPDLELIQKYEKTDNATNADRPSHPEMLAIELDNFVKEKANKLMQKYKPFQIRMKAAKLNEQFSVKILDQANIYLLFRDGVTNLKLNLGLLLKSNEIIDTDTSDMADVATPYDRHPARTPSVENIHKILKAVKSGKLAVPSDLTVRVPS